MDAHAFLLAEEKVADADVAVAHRRALHRLRHDQLRREAEPPDIGRQVRHAQRLEQIPEVREEPRAVRLRGHHRVHAGPADRLREGEARRARRDELHSRRRQPPGAAGRDRHAADLRGVERRAVGDRRRGRAVSLVCFSRTADESVSGARLDEQSVDEIHTDLTARRGGAGVDLTSARRLPENAGVAFMGDTKGGPFDVTGDQARKWLRLPANPNGRTNADVLKPWMNGMDLTLRSAGKWIVDFGWTMSAADAALYEEPFRWVKEQVQPMRQRNRREVYREYWCRHVEPRQGMWRALDRLSRYIATPTVAKHRLFVWCDARICPHHQLIVIARDDDTTFSILHSRFHELWSLRLGTSLEDRPRYTPSTTFETFPFPDGWAPDVPAAEYAGDPGAGAIAAAARHLAVVRERWLNLPEWVEWMDEPVPGLPEMAGATRRGRREGAEETHADKLVQCAVAVARRSPRGP